MNCAWLSKLKLSKFFCYFTAGSIHLSNLSLPRLPPNFSYHKSLRYTLVLLLWQDILHIIINIYSIKASYNIRFTVLKVITVRLSWAHDSMIISFINTANPSSSTPNGQHFRRWTQDIYLSMTVVLSLYISAANVPGVKWSYVCRAYFQFLCAQQQI